MLKSCHPFFFSSPSAATVAHSGHSHRMPIARRKPSSLPSIELKFFVRLLSQGILVVRARPSDTVHSVIEKIHSVTRIPCAEQRLIYAGRQLHFQSTLLRCGVKNDAMLHLTARLRSTRNSLAFQMAENLRSSIFFLLSTRRVDALNLQRNNIELHMRRFLLRIPKSEPKEDKEKSRTYFDALCYSGIPSLLVSLYLSPVEEIHGIGLRTIRIFLNSNDAFLLPEYMHFHCAPIVLTFCELISRAKGYNDNLYIECRSTLANFLSAPDIVPLGCTNLLLDVYLFIAGIVSLEDVALSRDTKQVSHELDSLFWAMEGTVKNWRNTKEAISKKFFENGNPEYEKGIGLLYELFMKLLSKVGQGLKKVEDIMDQKGRTQFVNELAAWSHFLVVLTLVRNFSKIFEGGKRLLDLLIFERKRVLKVLVRHARTDYMLLWSLKYKYLTDFDTRKLVLMMLYRFVGMNVEWPERAFRHGNASCRVKFSIVIGWRSWGYNSKKKQTKKRAWNRTQRLETAWN